MEGQHGFGSEEPFEKVDKIPEQDEEVTTSTSYTGEEAEEDRYESGITTSHEAAAASASENLLNLDDEGVVHSSERTPVSDSNVLLNFGSPAAPEPSAPPLAPMSNHDVGDLMGDFAASAKTDFSSEPESSPLMTESHVKPDQVEVSRPPAGHSEASSTVDTWLKNVDPREAEKEQDGNEATEGVHSPYTNEGTIEACDSFEPGHVQPIKEEPMCVMPCPSIMDLIYWKDMKKTGVVFGSMLFILLSLAIFSVLSVLAYLSLAILTVTLSFRVYKNVLQAVQKSGDAHPFRPYLDMNIEITTEQAENVVKDVLGHVNVTTRELRRLFLIEDLVDSLKFGLLLWVLTYIGSWFNGMTLIILGVVAVFTLPKVYETYKVQIDNYVNIACAQINGVIKQIQDKVPFLKKKEKKQ